MIGWTCDECGKRMDPSEQWSCVRVKAEGGRGTADVELVCADCRKRLEEEGRLS